MSAMATQTGSMTYEQYRALPDSDEYRYTELIDGVLVHKFAQHRSGARIVNAPNRRHQRAVLRLTIALDTWTHAVPGRGEAAHGVEVKINERNAYVPDVVWYPEARRPPEGDEFKDLPGLVVEVLSPSTRGYDRRHKAVQCARAGIDELWLVDADALEAKIYRRLPGAAVELPLAMEVGQEGELSSPFLPGFSLRLTELIRR